MEEKRVKPGDGVIKQGDPGDYFYIIDHGKYDVLKRVGPEEKKVFFYDGKGSFGELALMYNCPRAATVVVSPPAFASPTLAHAVRCLVLTARGRAAGDDGRPSVGG